MQASSPKSRKPGRWLYTINNTYFWSNPSHPRLWAKKIISIEDSTIACEDTGNPVTTRRATSNIIWKTWQILHKDLSKASINAFEMIPDIQNTNHIHSLQRLQAATCHVCALKVNVARTTLQQHLQNWCATHLCQSYSIIRCKHQCTISYLRIISNY